MIQCIADPNSPACAFTGLAVLFFWFSQCFFWFLTKSIKKPREIQKKQKTKLQTLTHQLVPTWVLQFCFFFVFSYGFLNVFFWFLTKSIKNLEKSKKTQKTKLQTLTHQLVPTWVLQFVLFLFLFGFLNVFLVFDQNLKK